MSLKRKRFAKALRVRVGVWAPPPGRGGYGGPIKKGTPAATARLIRAGGIGRITITGVPMTTVRVIRPQGVMTFRLPGAHIGDRVYVDTEGALHLRSGRKRYLVGTVASEPDENDNCRVSMRQQ